MSQDESQDRWTRAMRQLVDMVRAEPPPSVDWTNAERELGRRIAREAARRRTGQPRWQRRGFAAVSVFAAAAATLMMMVAGPEVPLLPSSPEAGRVLTSDSDEHAFSLGALAECRLGPNSRALVRCGPAQHDASCASRTAPEVRRRRGGLGPDAAAREEPYVLVLEQGSLSADVVPRPAEAPWVEALVVEAGGVRVAVHGTRFTVERGAHDVVVEVTRGSVAVGPAGHRGMTTGHLLVAPARAAFSIDGGRVARMLPPPTAPQGRGGRRLNAEPPAAPPPRAATSPQAPAAEPEPDTPPPPPAPLPAAAVAPAPSSTTAAAQPSEGPTREEQPEPSTPSQPAALELAGARANMVACLSGSAPPSGDGDQVRVTISSTVRLQLDDERRIIAVRFAPPLKPELQQRCAGTVLGRRLASGAGSAEFHVVFSPH